MKKPLLLIGALLGFALLTGSVTRGSSDLNGPGTIRITSREIQISVDNRGAPTRGAGDVLLIRQLLFNKGIRRQAIGHADLVCTFTGSRSRQCSGTYFLPKGKIVVAGSLRFRGFFKLAVVGGTDLYDNVRGSLTVTMLGRGPRRELLLFRLVV
jgi:hypothetical protein